jgi:hypothetical protein
MNWLAWRDQRTGRPRSIGASIGMNGCRRIGSRHVGPPVADRGWKRSFDDEIPLPRGRQLVTLEDAGNYVMKLPKVEHEAAEWQAAMEALILVATSGGQRCLRASAFVGGRPAGANDAPFRRIHCNG